MTPASTVTADAWRRAIRPGGDRNSKEPNAPTAVHQRVDLPLEPAPTPRGRGAAASTSCKGKRGQEKRRTTEARAVLRPARRWGQPVGWRCRQIVRGRGWRRRLGDSHVKWLLSIFFSAADVAARRPHQVTPHPHVRRAHAADRYSLL